MGEEKLKKIARELAEALDGVLVYGLRKPAGYSTGYYSSNDVGYREAVREIAQSALSKWRNFNG